MRVLFINYEYPPIGAGAATASAEMARSAVAMGHQVTVLTSAFEGNQGWRDEGGISVCRLRSRRERRDQSSLGEMASYVLRAAFALPGVLRRARPEGCVVFFSMPCGPLGLLFKLLSRAPYVVSLRGGDVPGTEPGLAAMHRRLRPLRRRVLSRALAVVANSPGLAELSRKADPVAVTVIPNGVDLVRFSPVAGEGHGPYRFLFVGRLNEQKNVALLLDAVAQLGAQAAVPFRVTVVGDGPLRDRLVEHAKQHGLDAIVEWIRWLPRERMPETYRAADCVVNPSRYEGMPNVILEAMACGVPVIVSDVAGNRDVVLHERCGLIVPEGDRDALAQAMARALSEPRRLQEMGKAAREHVAANYSWDAVAKRYLDLFLGARPGE